MAVNIKGRSLLSLKDFTRDEISHYERRKPGKS